MAEGNEGYISEGNCLISLKEKELWAGCPTTTIPSDVIRIYDYAFADSDLESIVIPEGVIYIMNSAFAGCKKLRHLTLPQTLKSAEGLFDDSVNLETVNAPARFRKYFLKLNAGIKFTAID